MTKHLLIAGLAVSTLLVPFASAASSADVVSVALHEVGYTETADEYTQYGKWYGLPNSYWCDMFVSWCGMKGKIPASKFPRNCSCTAHVKRFISMGRYQDSAARGGTYTPQQGDVIFFYNYLKHSSGDVKNHTGIVLYVEDGCVYAIEGNALTNRLDITFEQVVEFEDGDLEPLDHVTVNRYPLTCPRIHGYGVPDYDDRTPLQLNGFVDLGTSLDKAGIFNALCIEGIMHPTSTHTFSPHHGMTRAEFISSVVQFFGLSDYASETIPFSDVSQENRCYNASMTALSAGIISGTDQNMFLPDQYVSPDAAKAILNRALMYIGMPEQEFSFSTGDYSYMVTPYTTRADIAQAFFSFEQQLPLSEPFLGDIILEEEKTDWNIRRLHGVCYAPLPSFQAIGPPLQVVQNDQVSANEMNSDIIQNGNSEDPIEPNTASDQSVGDESVSEAETESSVQNEELTAEDATDIADGKSDEVVTEEIVEETPASDKLPVPMGNTDRVIPNKVKLKCNENMLEVDGLLYLGIQYVPLRAVAEMIGISVEWKDGEKPQVILHASNRLALSVDN